MNFINKNKRQKYLLIDIKGNKKYIAYSIMSVKFDSIQKISPRNNNQGNNTIYEYSGLWSNSNRKKKESIKVNNNKLAQNNDSR